MLILGDWPPRVWSKGVEMAKKVAEVVRASRAKLVVAGEGGGSSGGGGGGGGKVVLNGDAGYSRLFRPLL